MRPLPRRAPRLVLAALACGAVILGALGVTHAAFTQATQNPGNVITARPDWTPPSAGRSVVQKTEGGETGYVRTGNDFRAYAQVTDSGNPASGTAGVSLEVPTFGYSLPLTAGAFTVDGLAYNWASAVSTVPFFTFAGSYPYDVRMTDNLGQVGTDGTFPAVVDNTRPTATDVQTANGGAGAVLGRPNAGDSVTLTHSEPIDRISVVAGWTAGTAAVTARILNGTGATNDRLAIDGSNFGTVNLGRNDYVTAETTFTGSSLVRNATSQLVLTLGAVGAGTPSTAAGTGTTVYTPDADTFDRAGNLVNATLATESGAADREL